MNFEPINKFWLAKTNRQLAEDNARLRGYLLATAVMALGGWGLFLWRIL